jgi:peptide/nickel transport system substrate-binding protein
MRRLIAALFASTLLTSLGVPPAAFAAQAHVVRWSDGLDVQTLNPLLATSANVAWMSELTMAHLTRFDVHDKLVPELITEIPSQANGGISVDGRSITYHLRRDAKWSDGVPFDADDVTYTVGAILNRANNISSREAWDHVTSASASDKYTVVFRLNAPFAPFASSFFSTNSASCVLPKHILGLLTTINEAPYNALPVGIGPFRYTAFRRGDAVEMEANPYYFRGKPKLTKVVYKIITDENTLYTQLQTGELDLWAGVGGTFSDRVRHLAGVRAVTAPSPFLSGIYFNTTSRVVHDADVRRALRLATDRVYLLHNVFHDSGTLAESVVPRISADFDAALPQARYDPAAAERMLDAAGWKRGADGMRAKAGVPLVINIAIPSGYAPSAVTAEILRASWNKIGVGVEVKGYGMGTFFAPAAAGGILSIGKFDAAMLSLPGNVLADVAADYGCGYAPPNGFNETRYCNHAVDAQMNAYDRSYDPNQRAALARRFQRRIDADAPGIVAYERDFIYAFNARVTGFAPAAFGPFDNFMDVDLR